MNRGVVHRWSVVLASEFESRATVARPKSTIRALPDKSISILAYAHHGISIDDGNCAGCTHSLEISVDHVACVKIAETVGNAKQLEAG